MAMTREEFEYYSTKYGLSAQDACKQRVVQQIVLPPKATKEKEMNLYEVAIVKWPTRKESENGAAGEIILHPRPVLADSDQTAIAKAVSEAGVTLDGSIKVLCRPFV